MRVVMMLQDVSLPESAEMFGKSQAPPNIAEFAAISAITKSQNPGRTGYGELSTKKVSVANN